MASSTEVVRKPWRKLLYERQDYPDNYLDEKQLEKDLKINLYLQPLDLERLLVSSLIIDQEILSIFLFVSIFIHLQDCICSTESPLMFLVFLISLSFIVILATSGCNSIFLKRLKQSGLFLLFLSGTTPILKTLTESISTDSLWFMTIIMFMTHLLFHGYGHDGILVSDAVSLNAAIFASVCLSSRFTGSLKAFVLILTAVLLFAGLPKIRNTLYNKLTCTQFVMAILTQYTVVVFSLTSNGYPFLVPLLLLSLAVPIIGAFLYYKLQYLKYIIHGPWDEASLI